MLSSYPSLRRELEQLRQLAGNSVVGGSWKGGCKSDSGKATEIGRERTTRITVLI